MRQRRRQWLRDLPACRQLRGDGGWGGMLWFGKVDTLQAARGAAVLDDERHLHVAPPSAAVEGQRTRSDPRDCSGNRVLCALPTGHSRPLLLRTPDTSGPRLRVPPGERAGHLAAAGGRPPPPRAAWA